jgi:cytochrome c biogenesis protein CcmG/thiol:disulfide interchange protein DsbE
MNKRWILVLTAAIGIALLAVPLFIRPSATPSTEAAVDLEVPSIDSNDAPACKTASPRPLDFTLKDINGADVRLADYKGKVVLLNFWATWCGPCKVEIPEFVELYAEYKDRGFEILGVLANDTPAPDQLRTFMGEYKMSYPVLFSSEELESAFGSVWALPTSFLIGRDGAVCAKQTGPVTKDDVERSLKSLL